MNASCALHHFCDLHGPQTLLCTEGRTYIHDYNDNDNEDLKTYYSRFINAVNPQEHTECKSCTLSNERVLITTVDYSHHMEYISSSSTPNAELFKTIRHTCVRSLTTERSTESDQPVLFGDDENGYCLSFSFVCKDFYARGSQRVYSLCYLCHDKYHLLSVMNFIKKCMKQIIFWLQYDSNQTYDNEGQIQVSIKLNGIISATSVCRTLPCQPIQRMLSDIVRDSKVIYRIHALFVWILRTTNSAIQESLFEALPTEDQKDDVTNNEQIVRHQSEMVNESFYSNTTDNRNDIKSSLDDDDDDYDSLEYHFSSYGHQALRLFQKFIEKLNNINHLQYILYNWLIGNQLIIKYQNRTENKDFIRAFTSVFRLFLPDNCCHLIETTNQIATCTANLIIFDMDTLQTTNNCQQNSDRYSITIQIIFDSSDERIQLAQLETQPPLKSDLNLPTYVNIIVELLTNNDLDDDTLEAIIIQQKNKYLNKAKLYFQLGRCQIASLLSMNELQQMNILKITNPNDLLIIRFWQKGLSRTYKNQIRLLKQDDNQQRNIEQQ